MREIHCHRCGGFIGNPGGTTYREAPNAAPPVAPHSGLCVCGGSVIYGPDPGVHQLRSASRN